MPSLPTNGISFHYEDCVFKWKYVADKSVISSQHQSYSTVIDLITKVELLPTMTNLGAFYPKLIKEFIVNLTTDLSEPNTPNFKKVHVRGKCFDISHTLLNSFMKLSFPAEFVATLASPEQLALELFGGTIRVWRTHDQFPTIKLSVKYAILHKLALLTGIHPYIWPPSLPFWHS